LISILIVSAERYSGKSSLAVAMALELRERGLEVGYMKPVGAYPIKVDGIRVDQDAFFIREALGLSDKLSDLSPFFLTWEALTRYMRNTPGNPSERVRKCFDSISRGKDVMIIEGAQSFVHGRILGLSAVEISKTLGAGVLLLDTFNEELSVDRMLAASDYFSDRFLGTVLNWVPERKISFTRNQMKRFMAEHGIELFGSIPTDRVLRSISVDDLATGLNGRIICAPEKGEELVESMMVGAMGQEQALRLFRKQANKVVVTGGERSDIQIAALQTPTKALILTGNYKPSPLVVGQAEEMGVPVITVGHDTATTVEMVEEAIGKQRVNSPRKIVKMRELIEEGVDLDGILKKAREIEGEATGPAGKETTK
jgi:uncharacterized protein